MTSKGQSSLAATKLTDKQIDVLDLVLQHKSSKEIAKTLQISHYTVDQRIASARQKLGVCSRGELARKYAELQSLCGRTAYDFSQVDGEADQSQMPWQDLQEEPVQLLSDVASIRVAAPWEAGSEILASLETLDQRYGALGRVAVVAGLTVALTITFLVMVAIAQGLRGLV